MVVGVHCVEDVGREDAGVSSGPDASPPRGALTGGGGLLGEVLREEARGPPHSGGADEPPFCVY